MSKYRGYTILKSGNNYRVKDPAGFYAWSEPAVNIQTAKKWIDAHLAEAQEIATDQPKENHEQKAH
jgi:hypothetical protein